MTEEGTEHGWSMSDRGSPKSGKEKADREQGGGGS